MAFFKKDPEKSFPIPAITAPASEWEARAEGLTELGFRPLESLDEAPRALWPGSRRVFAHEVFSAFAELSVLPIGTFVVQFITLFPEGSVRTFSGDRAVTFSMLSPLDEIYWKSGSLASLWQEHANRVTRHEAETRTSALAAELETYHDFVNLLRDNFEKAIREDRLVPKTVCDYLLAGFGNLDLGRTKKGLEMFVRAAKLDPGSARLPALAGRVALAIHDFHAARASLSESLRLNPEDEETALLLALVYRLTNQKRRVYEVLKETQARFPESKRISLELGIAALDIGEFPDAKSSLEEINTVDMASPQLFTALAELYRKTGDRKKSDEYSRLAKVFAREKEDRGRLPWQL